ncbi:restriction endonuclease subunit S [Finegoldia magna]|uniref:restriction endonuclease subunit S n=2 Tax=Peptoniphilaceae TaxID=1570339 RepID=UPI00288C0151|nr:restriction endonuclease subunit S [Finegoldia magna]
MVNSAAKKLEKELIEIVEVPKDDINWSSVSLSDILTRDKRLEASTFNIDRDHALQLLNDSKYEVITLGTDNIGFNDCYYGPRAKRNYLSDIDSTSIGFLGSSEMLDIYPKPIKYVSPDNPMVKQLSLSEKIILISRSGTIGNVTFVNKSLAKYLVSEHAIRLVIDKFPGYVYAYLKTDIAQNLLHAEKFGSVILEIEPEALKNMPIPNPPDMIKKKIDDLILQSYAKRDESNKLIDEATKIMIDELELPPIEELKKEAFSYSKDINSFSTKLSDLNGRLEGNYHLPLVDVIEKYSSKNANLIKLNSEKITEKIILPGRFKRVYVEKGNGKIFLGGKEIGQLDPSGKKFLSVKHYSDKLISDITIKRNDILVTRSGTVGKVMMAPKHWENWVSSDHVIRILSKESYHGLNFIWLSSEYGKELIKRQIYGSVVNEITEEQLGDVVIPIFKDNKINMSILNLIDEANELRYQAYKQEQEAISIMNKEVLGL